LVNAFSDTKRGKYVFSIPIFLISLSKKSWFNTFNTTSKKESITEILNPPQKKCFSANTHTMHASLSPQTQNSRQKEPLLKNEEKLVSITMSLS
jgi:hypothetical protein